MHHGPYETLLLRYFYRTFMKSHVYLSIRCENNPDGVLGAEQAVFPYNQRPRVYIRRTSDYGKQIYPIERIESMTRRLKKSVKSPSRESE